MKSQNYLVLLLCILYVTPAYAQQQKIDSLLHLINSTELPAEKAKQLNTLGNLYRYTNQDSAFAYISKAREIAELNDLPIQLSEAYNELGMIWKNKKEMDSAYFYLNKGYHLAKENEDYRGMVKSLNANGIFKCKAKDYKTATILFNEALNYINNVEDQRIKSMLFNNLAILNKTKGKVNVALVYYHKALKIAEEQNNLKGAGLVASNIGLLYEAQDKTDLALKYLNQSLDIRIELKNKVGESYVRTNLGLVYENLKDYDKALSHYRKSLSIKKEINSKRGMAILYNNMGIIFKKQNLLDSAQYYSSKSLIYRIKLKDKTGEARTRTTLGQIHLLNNKPKQARKELLQALELSKDYQNYNFQQNLNRTLYEVFASLNEYKNATGYLLKSHAYKDSIFNINKEKSIATIEAKYNSLKKERDNLVLQRENDLKDARIKRQLIIEIVLATTAILILILLIMIYKSRQELREKNTKINEQAKVLTETLHELRQLSNFKESMMSMMVHDLKTPLNVVVNYKDLQGLSTREELLQQSGYTMLNLVHNILDVYKYQDNQLQVYKEKQSLYEILNKALEEVSFWASESKLEFHINSTNDYTINADAELLKRVFVNLFTNAIKYTPINEVITISCQHKSESKVRIEVANPGPGIPKDQQELIFEYFKQANNPNVKKIHSSGLGLNFCKLAIEAHEGEIGVISETQQGVVFWIDLPEAEPIYSEFTNIIKAKE